MIKGGVRAPRGVEGLVKKGFERFFSCTLWHAPCIWEISPRAENDPIKLGFFRFTADFFFFVILLWKLLKTFYIP